MKYWLLIFVYLAGCNVDVLRPICGNAGPGKCYAVPGISTWLPEDANTEYVKRLQKNAGVGICNLGKAICDKKYNIISCEGDIPPGLEICDAYDNNCNGETNERLQNVSPQTAADELGISPCKIYGECAGAKATCFNEKWKCDYPGKTEFPDETSWDCLDNDCDGRPDEDLLPATCFDDEWWKATNGECSPGFEQCEGTQIFCGGPQQLPEPEVCNRKDDDCNGIIDDGLSVQIPDKYDIVLALDTSGSMCGEIAAVLGACDAYVEQYENDPNYQFALVVMTAGLGMDLTQTLVNFGNIIDVRDALQSLGCNGSAWEASLDILFQLCEHLDGEHLNLNWRPEANALIFSFTDEPPQTYVSPPVDDLMIIDSCLEHRVIPIQWSQNPGRFGPIVTASNGVHFTVVSDFQQMLDNMNSIVVTACGS